jgi:hypothetical protein
MTSLQLSEGGYHREDHDCIIPAKCLDNAQSHIASQDDRDAGHCQKSGRHTTDRGTFVHHDATAMRSIGIE